MDANLSGSIQAMLSAQPDCSGPECGTPWTVLQRIPTFNSERLSDFVNTVIMARTVPFTVGRAANDPSISYETMIIAGVLAAFLYATVQFLRPFVALYGHLRRARAVGLPMKVIPFPPGLFSFFAFQVLRKLGLLAPGTKLHKLLSMGRPDGYDLHKEMGDVFLTVSPAGLTLIVADPKVAAHINNKRAEFPKPPNTGAIINIYGRNVINADGDVWRFHRRVTGPVFSERIHGVVWNEGMNQAKYMMEYWQKNSEGDREGITRTTNFGDDSLRLGLNVITGSAYNHPLGWDENPPCSIETNLSYRQSMEQMTAHLMPIFLTPHWLLRLAKKDSTWGRAWEGYTAFRGYMRGMLEAERAKMVAGESMAENLLTVLIDAENQEDEKEERKMTNAEVMGNMFIMLFAGHETTANTLHYALLVLAQYPEVQQTLLDEIDTIYAQAALQGRTELEYELDFNRARWTFAIMYETLRIYTPTGMTNKWSATDQPIAFEGRTYVIPKDTRISINGTGIHFNPKVWGDNANDWDPSRWITEGGDGDALLLTPSGTPPLSPMEKGLSVPPSPNSLLSPFAAAQRKFPSFRPSLSRTSSYATVASTATPNGIMKPPKGTYLPFSEGSRACSGKKFATVEFVAVLFTLLRSHRVVLEDDWSAERVKKVLSGRKAGGLTLQPPENIPLNFIKR